MAPIVRALLAPNQPAALDALRSLPRFGRHLGPAMRQHLAHRRSLGFRYEREEWRLLQFDRYLQTRPDAAQLPVHVLVREYAEQATRPPRPASNGGKAAGHSRRACSAMIRRCARHHSIAWWSVTRCTIGATPTFIPSTRCSAC